MAERRMFSKKIVDSARFIKMPLETQSFYFHLGLRADDDGVVEAYSVMRLLGITEDSLRILVAKGFITVLNDDLVSHITDWKEHNLIRPDRKVDSIYKDLLIQLMPDISLIEKRERADKKHTDNQWTSNGQHSIVEDSIGKDRENKKASRFTPPSLEEISTHIQNNKFIINPESFFHYYESIGWKVGNKPMKSWTSALAQWNAKEKAKQPANVHIPSNSKTQGYRI